MLDADGWDEARADEIIGRHRDMPGAMLPLLHALQHEFGYVPKQAVQPIAHALNVSRAEVHGVISFYHDFHTEKPARHVLKLCRAESCQSRGGNELAEHAERRLGVAVGEATADGAVSLEAVYCLGLCSLSPSAMLDGRIHARLTPARLDALIEEART